MGMEGRCFQPPAAASALSTCGGDAVALAVIFTADASCSLHKRSTLRRERSASAGPCQMVLSPASIPRPSFVVVFAVVLVHSERFAQAFSPKTAVAIAVSTSSIATSESSIAVRSVIVRGAYLTSSIQS